MERIPNGRYTQEFREEAVKMATDGGLSVLEISKRLSLPKSTLEHWIRVSKAGHLGKIGKGQRPLTDVERELAKVKQELSLAKMERTSDLTCSSISSENTLFLRLSFSSSCRMRFCSLIVEARSLANAAVPFSKKLLLPGIKDLGLQLVLVAQV